MKRVLASQSLYLVGAEPYGVQWSRRVELSLKSTNICFHTIITTMAISFLSLKIVS